MGELEIWPLTVQRGESLGSICLRVSQSTIDVLEAALPERPVLLRSPCEALSPGIAELISAHTGWLGVSIRYARWVAKKARVDSSWCSAYQVLCQG